MLAVCALALRKHVTLELPAAWLRTAGIWAVGSVFWAYCLALGAGPFLVCGSLAQWAWQRRNRRAIAPLAAKTLVLGVSCLLGVIALEGAARLIRVQERRLPRLPELPALLPAERGGQTRIAGSASLSARETHIVVIGESSGRGEPYDPWLSVGQILGWQLERVFPGRPVTVQMLARPGLNLRQALERLAQLRRRPDAILLYSGHNEFQSRYSWSRSVPHYRRDPPAVAAGVVRRGRLVSGLRPDRRGDGTADAVVRAASRGHAATGRRACLHPG